MPVLRLNSLVLMFKLVHPPLRIIEAPQSTGLNLYVYIAGVGGSSKYVAIVEVSGFLGMIMGPFLTRWIVSEICWLMLLMTKRGKR